MPEGLIRGAWGDRTHAKKERELAQTRENFREKRAVSLRVPFSDGRIRLFLNLLGCVAFLRPYNYEEVGILYTYEIYEECRCTFSSRSMFQNGKSLRIIVIRVMHVYCILDYEKIAV